MVFASMRAVRLFSRVIKAVLRAASTLENKESEKLALRSKFSARRNLSFIKRNVLRQVF